MSTAINSTGDPRGITIPPRPIVNGSARLALNLPPVGEFSSIGSIVLTWITVPAGTVIPALDV
jgi:hypothetical protein